jgi:hypothetical protein
MRFTKVTCFYKNLLEMFTGDERFYLLIASWAIAAIAQGGRLFLHS